MRSPVALLVTILVAAPLAAETGAASGVRGEPAAIAEARAMVETMGGLEIWKRLESVHFVHEWRLWNRPDAYVENEILDLTGPRSWVEMKSEIYHRLRAYSPEHKYWNMVDGEFAWASDDDYRNAMERAPFNLYRVARAVAIGDPFYELRFGEGDLPRTRHLDLYGPDGDKHGWIVLNARKEPLVWATTQYRYTFGPMRRYGNLRVPAWGVTGNGAVTFEMISLTGDDRRPEPSLFAPPPGAADGER